MYHDVMYFIDDKEEKKLLIEYQELHNEIIQRNHYAWFIISIFLAGTFIVSFGTQNPRSITYLVSIILTGFSWIIQEAFKNVNESCWKRRQAIQHMLNMQANITRYEELKKTTLYKIEKHIWRIIFIFLIVTYAVLFYFSFNGSFF